jgi:hypothetical protein
MESVIYSEKVIGIRKYCCNQNLIIRLKLQHFLLYEIHKQFINTLILNKNLYEIMSKL